MFGEKWQKGAQHWILYGIVIAVAVGAMVTMVVMHFAQ